LRLWTAVIIAIGYAGFLAWFVLLGVVAGAFFAGSVTIDSAGGLVLLALGGVIFAFGVVQAFQLLWVSFEPAPGHRLMKSEAPELFRLLAELRSSYRAVRVHQVILTYDFNASVQQVPRLGPFGWPRNVLHIGLPLAETLSRVEFEAVLAHEFGHLSAKDGRFSAWVAIRKLVLAEVSWSDVSALAG
jgi:Zn-dependent protease with chaperone function